MDFFSLYPQIQSSFPSLAPIAASLWLSITSSSMGTMALALALLTTTLLCPATATLHVGAFNIQAFGDTKMSDEGVAGIIVSVSVAGDGLCTEVDPKRGSCATQGCGHGWDGTLVRGCPGWMKVWWGPRWGTRRGCLPRRQGTRRSP